MATTTMTESEWELQPHPTGAHQQSIPQHAAKDSNVPRSVQVEHDAMELPSPTTATHALQRWNSPKANVYRLAAVFYAFVVVGLNDAAYGPLIPLLEAYYNLDYTVISLVFLSPFAGYTLAAFSNNAIHMHFGQRGIAILAPVCHLIPFIILSQHPPYPVLVVVFIVVGYGNGLIDAGWCAWTGGMASANAIQGIMHSFYSGGGTVSPLIATAMTRRAGLPWYTFYYMMSGAAALELVTSAWAWWPQDSAAHREQTARQSDEQGGRTREALRNRVTWLCSVFLFAYVGAEVSLGGWIVTFMLNVRKAGAYESGVSATGFWAGMTLGRAGLGFVTDRFGERVMVIVYLVAALAMELIFWLVPTFVVSAVAVALLGVFMGPLFPAGIVMATKLLPRHLHVSAVGFATAIGGTGGAVMPFIVGAIAQAKGVQVLQPIILALLAAVGVIWLSLPRIKKREDD